MNWALTAVFAALVVLGPVALFTGCVWLYANHSVRVHDRAITEQSRVAAARSLAAIDRAVALDALRDDDRAWLEAHGWRAEGIEPGAEPAVLDLPEVPPGPAQGAR